MAQAYAQSYEELYEEDDVIDESSDVQDSKVEVEEHMEFARRLAHRFYSKRAHSQAEIDDVVSSAYLGLCEASSRFEKDKGDRFQTFSYFRIIGSMYEYLKSNGGLSRLEYKRLHGEDKEKKKAPLYIADSLKQLGHLQSQIEESGIKVNVNEDSNSVELSYAGEELQEEYCSRKQVASKLRVALEQLPEEMQIVIVGKYFNDHSLTDLTNLYPGMSKSRLSRLHAKALMMLRERLVELL